MMKKLSSALVLMVALLANPLTWQHALAATTQSPIYQLDNKPVLGRVENVYFSGISELAQVPLLAKLILVLIAPLFMPKMFTYTATTLSLKSTKMTNLCGQFSVI